MDIEEALRIITQRKYHILEMRLSKYDLVKGQANLLILIRDNDGITQNELAEIIGIKDSSMSVRLDKLERNGYIVREIDVENLKRKKIYRRESMRKKRKLLKISCLICAIIAISGVSAACSKFFGKEPTNSVPNENTENSIPEGVVDFDETWLNK